MHRDRAGPDLAALSGIPRKIRILRSTEITGVKLDNYVDWMKSCWV